MQREITPLWGEKKVVLRQTPRAVTPFASALLERPPAIKIGRLENGACATGTFQTHGHGDGAVLKERTPPPGHVIHLPPCRAKGIVNPTGEKV